MSDDRQEILRQVFVSESEGENQGVQIPEEFEQSEEGSRMLSPALRARNMATDIFLRASNRLLEREKYGWAFFLRCEEIIW